MSDVRLGRTIPALPVRSVGAAVAHYRDRFGFTPVHVDEHAFAVLRRDDAILHLWQAADESWQLEDTLPDSPVCSGAESFLAGTGSCRIEADGVDELWAELRAAGVLHHVSAGGPGDTAFGTREFAALDLDGNLVEFFRWTAPHSPS